MIYPTILCGGSGTRLWPLSRQSYPKQFLCLTSENSLLQETALRVVGGGFSAPILLCNHEHRFLVSEQMQRVGISPTAVCLEPVPRSTAPAAAIAALLAQEKDEEATVLLLPSDHAIGDLTSFTSAVQLGLQAAKKGKLVTFGIAATKPETGYGYIRPADEIEGVMGVRSVQQFVEKPGAVVAEKMVSEGGYYWNSGIFLFQVSTYLEELSRLEPYILSACKDAIKKSERDLDFLRLDYRAYEACASVSIDVAVMEKTGRAAVVPTNMDWCDLGGWAALWEAGSKDDNNNVLKGNIVAQDVSGSYLHSAGPMLAAIGVENIVVVADQDTVLVAPKNRSREVKDLVECLKKKGRPESSTHLRVFRPWGWYQKIDVGEGFQVKRICVNPGKRLSMQYHNRRAEHWIVVNGVATVTRGEQTFPLIANQSTYIPIGEKHRLENHGDKPLYFIEVQTGDYLGEDDIVRLDDDFGRN